MDGTALLVPGALVVLAYLFHPLVSDDLDTPWERAGLLGGGSDSVDGPEEADHPRTGPNGRRAMTDGGRVCHSCGAHVEGDYLYCAECLTPRV